MTAAPARATLMLLDVKFSEVIRLNAAPCSRCESFRNHAKNDAQVETIRGTVPSVHLKKLKDYRKFYSFR